MNLYKAFGDKEMSLFIEREDNPNTERFHPHIHEFHEIYCFISGDAEFIIEGNVYPLKPGDILLARHKELHCVRLLSQAPYTRLVFNFNPLILKKIDPELNLMAPFDKRPLGIGNLYRLNLLNGPALYEFTGKLADSDFESPHIKTKVLSYMFYLMESIYEIYTSPAGSLQPSNGLQPKLNEIIQYINAHLKDDLNSKQLSNQFFISESQLGRLFKSSTNMSVGEYINQKRLYLAQSMILQDVPLAEVCTECGFNYYSSFYRAYKKQFGASPSGINKGAGS